MTDKENFDFAAQFFPELRPGIDKREKLAREYAEKDAPVLGKDVNHLAQLYNQLFFGIALDSLLEKVTTGATAQQRWNLVEPFTW